MRKNPIVHFLSYFIPILIIIYVIFTCLYYLSCFSAAVKVGQNTNQEYLRIKIYGSSESEGESTVSGRFSIIDSNMNEIAVIERSWSGSYLSLEFACLSINGKTFVFPSKIYGKNRIIEKGAGRSRGIKLEKYYNDNGQCMLLGFGSTLAQRRSLYRLSALAVKKYPLVDFGLVDNFVLDLSDCKTNTYYSIRGTENGEIIISRL